MAPKRHNAGGAAGGKATTPAKKGGRKAAAKKAKAQAAAIPFGAAGAAVAARMLQAPEKATKAARSPAPARSRAKNVMNKEKIEESKNERAGPKMG